jgi:hypothetical protein
VRPRCYRIIVSGRLGEASRAAFEDLRIEPYGTDTALIGELDPPGLRGVLDRLLAIRLELVELSCLADGAGRGQTAAAERQPYRRQSRQGSAN